MCWLPVGHALCLLFMGTCSRNFAGRPPSRMLLEDLPGGVCTNKVWPCQLSQNPCLRAGSLCDPSGKGCCLHHLAKRLLHCRVGLQLPLLRYGIHIVVYIKYRSSWVPLPPEPTFMVFHVVCRNSLLGLLSFFFFFLKVSQAVVVHVRELYIYTHSPWEPFCFLSLPLAALEALHRWSHTMCVHLSWRVSLGFVHVYMCQKDNHLEG